MSLRPFFSYYGSKWLLARHYPAPLFDTVIEPFAGSAGYALTHHERDVLLVDSNPVVAGLWQYLIRVTPAEVLALPAAVESVDDVHGPEEARSLVGFWLGRATSSPRRTLSKWGRDGRWPMCFWGPQIRDRIASQVGAIKHWRAVCGDFRDVGDVRATWFIDAPYERQGVHYRSAPLNYGELAAWAAARHGQVIVCENHGAAWLPFTHFRTARANSSRGHGRVSREVVWFNAATPAPETAGTRPPRGMT